MEAVAPDGGNLRLKWQGRLWRFPDESYYLFYTPLYWRPLPRPAPARSRPAPPASLGVGRGLLGLLGWGAGALTLAAAAAGLTSSGPTGRQVALSVILAAVGLALLFGGAAVRAGWILHISPTRRRGKP